MGLELALPPRRSAARRMRTLLRTYLVQQGVEQPVCEQVVLAAGEALNNAIIHAGDVHGRINVTAAVHDGLAWVEVRDLGCGFDARAADPRRTPDTRRPNGRGLFIMRRMMDQVEISSGGRGTTVHMVRRIA